MAKEILALFDESTGRRTASVIRGANYDTDAERERYMGMGYIVISEEDWALYCDQAGGDNGRGYIRDPLTGRPVSAPPYVPTIQEKADALYNECSRDIIEIDEAILSALADGDGELLSELREEKAERIRRYKSDLEEIMKEAA